MPSRLRPALRRLRLPLAALLVLAVALAWWLAGRTSLGYPQGTYGFATGTRGGVYDLYGSLFKPVVEREVPGVRLRLDPSAGGPDNLERIATGQDAFGVATADAVAAYNGPGKDRLQALGRLYDDYVQLVVPSDSDIRTVADLRGKRVGTGQANSGVALIASRVLQLSGLHPGHDVTSVPLGIKDAPGELRAGRIDAFFWSGGLPTFNVSALSADMRIRLIPLGGLASAMDSLAQTQDAGSRGTQLYRTSSIPASAYP
ncbi:TAXI family TRAP transporter solute-binding subunit [Streptacidiphilus monticola]